MSITHARTRFDALDAPLRDDVHALSLEPALQQCAARWRHHRAQDLADAAGDHGQSRAAFHQRLHADAGDESGADHHHPGTGLQLGGDETRVVEGPARDHPRQVGARYRRQCRRRAGGHQQPVIGERGAVVEIHRSAVGAGMDLDGLVVAVADAEAREVAGGLARPRTLFVDAAGQDVGDSHARIGLAWLPADQGDLASRVLLPDDFGGLHAGWAGTDQHVFQAGSSHLAINT